MQVGLHTLDQSIADNIKIVKLPAVKFVEFFELVSSNYSYIKISLIILKYRHKI